MTWIPSSLLLYVETHPKHILYGNCLVTGLSEERGRADLQERDRFKHPCSNAGCPAGLRPRSPWSHWGSAMPAPYSPFTPPHTHRDHLSWSPTHTTAPSFFCQAHPWVTTTVLASPPTISLSPPFLSIPTAPRPLLLQAWIIIIAS